MFKTILATVFITLLFQITYGQKTIFYLHGAIVEGKGNNAENKGNGFGPYKYDDIVGAFKKEHFKVVSEVRPANTDVKEYAHKVVTQIETLLKSGTKASDITVVGASKGGMIAMYVSSFLKNKEVNYVFLSNCNDYNLESNLDISFCGNILSIFEKSDNVAASCEKYKLRSKLPMPHYKELELNTGLKHGYIYRPIPEWFKPATKWAMGDYK
jgi:hypothetical protein